MNQTHKDLIKVFLWRLISIPVSILVAWLYTGNANVSISLTIILTIVLTILQFFYEKLWRYITSKHI